VQPTLRWEHFPRDYDLIGAGGQRHQITDVRYDFRVFEGIAGSYSGPQVYEVRDIPESYHRIQSGLKACSDYYWTVRARFKLDGRIRATEWAGAFAAGGWNENPWNLRRGLYSWGQGPYRADWFYYPFRTPCH
jgi:hypothetical protein